MLSGALGYRFGSGFRAGARGTFYTGVPADVAYLAAALDPPRTTPFYRIDVRLEKRWRLNDSGAAWAVVLLAAGRLLVSVATRRVVVQGG